MSPQHPVLRRIARGLMWTMTVGWLCYAGWRLFGPELSWAFIAANAFAPYIAVATILPLGLALGMRSLPATTLVVVSLCALITVMVPRLFTDEAPGADGPKLRVLSVNLLGGEGAVNTVMSLTRDNDIDVLSVQELTPGSAKALKRAGMDDLLPHQELEPDNDAAGAGIYSRHPMSPRPQLATEGRFWMPAVAINVPESNRRVEFLAVHPASPINAEAFDDWQHDLAALPAAPAADQPRILAGDFNASLDHAALRDLVDTGYTDAADATGDGLKGTWPTDKPIPKVTLDHILVNQRTNVDSYAVHDLPGSDHRAVSAQLTLSRADN